MSILNIQDGKRWLGEMLGRRGPVSEKTWRSLVAQGLPVGVLAGSKFVSTAAVEAWLEEQAGLPRGYTAPSLAIAEPPLTKRRRGRPPRNW